MDDSTPTPLFRVLSRLGLLEFEDVDAVAAEVGQVLTPEQAERAARLLVVSLEAHHRLMIRRIAGRIGENLQEFAALRESLGV